MLVPLAILAERTVSVSGAPSAAWVGTHGAGWSSRLVMPERKAMVASAADRPVGRCSMGTSRFGSMSTPAKDVDSGDIASSAPAFRDRYPLGSFEKEKWGGYLSSYKKDPARLLLAIAEDSVARGDSGSVPLDFGPLFRPKMLLLHDADDVRDSQIALSTASSPRLFPQLYFPMHAPLRARHQLTRSENAHVHACHFSPTALDVPTASLSLTAGCARDAKQEERVQQEQA